MFVFCVVTPRQLVMQTELLNKRKNEKVYLLVKVWFLLASLCRPNHLKGSMRQILPRTSCSFARISVQVCVTYVSCKYLPITSIAQTKYFKQRLANGSVFIYLIDTCKWNVSALGKLVLLAGC
jgi:hypothetical protein